MAIYTYKNGAWQEAETPKKYSNGAWEDTDGYVCENGVWVQKWSKIQPLYLIKDGVLDSSVTVRVTRSNVSVSSAHAYSSSDKAFTFTGKPSSRNKSGGYYLRFSTTNSAFVMEPYSKIKMDCKQNTSGYSESRIILENYINSTSETVFVHSFYPTLTRQVMEDDISHIGSSPENGQICDLVFSMTYTSSSISNQKFYIYNLWFE